MILSIRNIFSLLLKSFGSHGIEKLYFYKVKSTHIHTKKAELQLGTLPFTLPLTIPESNTSFYYF